MHYCQLVGGSWLMFDNANANFSLHFVDISMLVNQMNLVICQRHSALVRTSAPVLESRPTTKLFHLRFTHQDLSLWDIKVLHWWKWVTLIKAQTFIRPLQVGFLSSTAVSIEHIPFQSLVIVNVHSLVTYHWRQDGCPLVILLYVICYMFMLYVICYVPKIWNISWM